MEETLSGARIDPKRLYASLEELGAVGAYDDEGSGLKGVNRLALTDAERDGRALVVRWFKEAGLEVSIDAIGNCYAERPGAVAGSAPVMMGSHIDSVPTAGRYDGCLGVLGAQEIIRTLDARKIKTKRPIVAAFFTDEEGCRFGTDMLGSAVATGRIPLDEGYAKTDRDGLTVKAELERTGFLGSEPIGLRKPHAYLECHIEQGPVLRSKNLDLGVVTGVQAICWHELEIRGRSAHAGTTPMSYRKDPGVAAAKINLKLREMTASGEFGPDMRATMGVIRPVPGMINVVPARVVCSADLRNPDDDAMARQEAALIAYYKQVEKEEGVEIRWKRSAQTPRIRFDASVQETIADAADALRLSHERILSGAGHDAQEWSRICKTAMIFVPGEYDGISHNPREYSTEKQCSDGIFTALIALTALANED